MARIWMFVAALSGGFSVIAGAIGAHRLSGAGEAVTRIYNTGQLYQALHSLALLAVGLALFASQGRRAAWAGVLLNAAAALFAIGIIGFSGGIYAQVSNGFTSSGGIVPFGGFCLILGWIAFAAGIIGLKGRQ